MVINRQAREVVAASFLEKPWNRGQEPDFLHGFNKEKINCKF